MPRLTELNEKAVRGLPTPQKGQQLYFVSDAKVQGATVPRGLVVRVTANGARSFLLSYWQGPKERRITIGKYPAWKVAAARGKAEELRKEIDNGPRCLFVFVSWINCLYAHTCSVYHILAGQD